MAVATTYIHPFEKAGLGKAPFRYVSMIAQEIRNGERVIGSVGGCEITTKPGGTCDYCGTYIVNMFKVRSSDDQEFKVGCDCIYKVDTKLTRAIEPDIKKAKLARENARIAEAIGNLPHAHSLHSQPHPTKYMADQGKTLWHYCQFLLTRGGQSGKLSGARMVERAIANHIDE